MTSTYNWCGCGLSVGGIIGVVVAVILAVIVIGVLLYYCVVVRRRRQRQAEMRNVLVTKDIPVVNAVPM